MSLKDDIIELDNLINNLILAMEQSKLNEQLEGTYAYLMDAADAINMSLECVDIDKEINN